MDSLVLDLNISNSINFSTKRQSIAVRKLVENGAWAGFISAWSISSVLLIVELTSRVQSGIFYSVIGIALGVTGGPVNSALAGFLFHILTGTIIGAAGGFSIAVCPVDIYRIAKSLAVGVSIGMVAWTILFLPITALLVLPLLDRVLVPSASSSELYTIASQASGMLTVIVAGSIVFHALYGLVYGIMMMLLIQYKSKELKNIPV